MHRDEWCAKLDEIFRQYDLGNGKYEKNYSDIYDMVNKYEGVITAIKYAKRRMDGYDESNMAPSDYDPGTTVYQLVEELIKYLE